MELPQKERGLCLGEGKVHLGEGVHQDEGMYAKARVCTPRRDQEQKMGSFW